MKLLQYRGIVIAILIVLLAGAGYLGWYSKSRFGENQTAIVQQKLDACEADQQAALRGVQDAAGWAKVIDIELGKSEAERKQQKKNYEDTLAIIRAMLPDAAEREIANYYASRQQHPR